MTREISLLETRLRQRLVRGIVGPLFLRGVGRLVFGAETRMRRSLPIERHCNGCGIEIGAAASPALVPLGVRVRYVDKYPHDVISADPELAGLEAVRPDVVCSAEKLEAIGDDSHDFVLAFSLLEHVQDPIGALASFTRVTRPGGTIIVSVPDKRFYGPDKGRPLTPFEHLRSDYERGPEWSREAHFRESGELVRGLEGEQLEAHVRELMDADGHTHFHVWDADSFLEFVQRTRRELSLPYELVEYAQYGHETLCVLRVVA